MQPSSRQRIAAEELRVLDERFQYKDYRLLEKGRYDEVVRRFSKQARHQLWLSVASSLLFAAWGASALVEYGASGDLFDLTFGVLTLAFAFVQQVFWARSSLRIELVAERVMRLFENDSAHARHAEKRRQRPASEHAGAVDSGRHR